MHRSRIGLRTAPCPTARTAKSHMGRRCSWTPGRDDRGRCPRKSRGSGRWPVLQRSSCRLAYRVEVLHANAAPLARIGPDLLDRDDMLMLVLPGIPDENGEGADQPEDG